MVAVAVTYRVLKLRETIKEVLKKVEAQVLITPKVSQEFSSAAEEELKRILNEDMDDPQDDIKKEVIH